MERQEHGRKIKKSFPSFIAADHVPMFPCTQEHGRKTLITPISCSPHFLSLHVTNPPLATFSIFHTHSFPRRYSLNLSSITPLYIHASYPHAHSRFSSLTFSLTTPRACPLTFSFHHLFYFTAISPCLSLIFSYSLNLHHYPSFIFPISAAHMCIHSIFTTFNIIPMNLFLLLPISLVVFTPSILHARCSTCTSILLNTLHTHF